MEDQGTDDDDDGSKAWDSGEVEEVAMVVHRKEMEVFTNGLGVDLVRERFKTVVEMSKRQKSFFENGKWFALSDFVSLTYLWHKQRQGRMHQMADVICMNMIVSRELSYKDVFAYNETRGWTISRIKGTNCFTLQYRKIEEALPAGPMNECSCTLSCNVCV